MTDIDRKIAGYPPGAQRLAEQIRKLVHSSALKLGIPTVHESLTWNEPTFKSPSGSPFRMDWKEGTPESFYLFFHCQTLLVEIYKTIYPDTFTYQGNRAIVLSLHEPYSEEALTHCIMLALQYHRIKHLPLLGA